MTTSLKSFIKSIRTSKTIADERSIIRRESALIRTSFKDTTISHQTRRINIQKLLYLYILGEKTHFGQIECIKLLASSNFIDKRLGYLATMLILDENQELLTLLTNSLNNDLNHPNQFIVALALATLGNIASPELARDLYTDVEKILNGNNAYLKKKAAMVASKIIEKDPDLSEIFITKIDSLLDAQDHAILLGTLKLIRSIYQVDSDSRQTLLKHIPKIFDILKKLTGKTLHPEYDTMGLSDPFLQISAIKTLALFFTDEDQLSFTNQYLETLNDTLTSIVSYTSYSKNAGASILHESVKTIFNIPNLDPALKVLGINTLGQLLSTKENNNRYVALNTLLTVVNIEPLAVQRHRQTIVACLHDLDISIKRRALELSFAILDSSNIRILIKEILTFLDDHSDLELINYIITNVTNILENRELIPNEKWKFDTIIKLVKVGGGELSNSVVSQILALIMNIPNGDELKSYTINKIFKLAYEDTSKIGLNLINVYLIGEYADLLINTKIDDKTTITEKVLTDYLLSLSELKDDLTLTSFLLTSSLKLSTKISSKQQKDQLKQFINSEKTSIDLNIQIKAVSYSVLFNEPEKIKKGILDRIPPLPIKAKETITLTQRGKTSLSTNHTNYSTKSSSTSKTKAEDLLLDLMDDDDNVGGNNGAGNNTDSVNLLEDIFGGKPQSSSTSNTKDDILGLFGPTSIKSTPTPATTTTTTSSNFNTSKPRGVLAHQTSNVKLFFFVKFIGKGEAIIETSIENLTNSSIGKLQLLIAVPKNQKLTMSSISSTVIESNSFVTQDLKIIGNVGSKIKLRVKFEYEINGGNVVEQFDFGKFEKTL